MGADAVFNGGILSPESATTKARSASANIAVLGRGGQAWCSAGRQNDLGIEIRVEQGAKISTRGVGDALLLASRNVTNAGTIETPGWPDVLAAGEKVYLRRATSRRSAGCSSKSTPAVLKDALRQSG